jgi:hypothetical protein
MKNFNLKVENLQQLEELYNWCSEHIGTENVLWWDAAKQVRGVGGQNVEIWIEENDQATMFALIWGHLASCEVW